MELRYASEQAARDAYLRELLSYCGITEGGKEHKQIVALYNQISPRPRGYAASIEDDWCAIFLCAVAWGLGFREWPWECSCPKIMTAAKAQGIWHNGWDDGAQLGRWVLYDFNGNGSADHIGAVVHVDDTGIWVAEANYGNTVKVRRIEAGDDRVLGFVALPYGGLVEAPAEAVAALRPGDSGERVYLLQVILKGAGYYAGLIDGDYGASTTAAVAAFQTANALEADGKCGPATQGKLRSGSFVLKTVDEEVESVAQKIYKRVEDVPEYARPTIGKLVDRGLLLGVDVNDLGLTDDLIRMLVINDRAGLYDKNS